MSRRSIREPAQVTSEEILLAEKYLSAAKELATARNFLGSLESLSLALTSVRDHPEALLLQACVRAAQGRPELASKELEKFANKYASWISSGNTIQGWLSCYRSQTTTRGQRRWYVLKDKFLFYYREPTDPLPLSGYVIETAALAQDTLGDARDLTYFTLSIPPSISYAFDAFDTKSRAEWLSVLMEANLIDPFLPATKLCPNVESLVSGSSSLSDTPFKEPVLLEGWLSKRGSTNKAFKLRWFSLRGTLLTYAEQEGKKPLGSIDIRNCKIRQGNDGPEVEFPFQLITSIRTYYLDSEHADTTRAWIVAIFNAQEDAAKIATPDVVEEAYDPAAGSKSPPRKSVQRPVSMAPSSRSSSSPSASPSSSPSVRPTDLPSTRKSWMPNSPDSSSSSTGDKKNSPRHTINPVVGRKLGGALPSLQDIDYDDDEVGTRATIPTPYLGGSRNRTSALTRDSKHAVEMSDLRAPREALIALAALNEDEEIRRNKAVLSARGRYGLERTDSEILSEPLLTHEILEEIDEIHKEESSCSWCSVM